MPPILYTFGSLLKLSYKGKKPMCVMFTFDLFLISFKQNDINMNIIKIYICFHYYICKVIYKIVQVFEMMNY